MDYESPAAVPEAVPRYADGGRGIGRALKIVLLIIVIGLIATFIVQNFEDVEVRMFVWEINVQLSLALLIFGVVGFLLGALLVRILR